MDLHVLWFCLLGVLLMGYAILDGFDLGVGILHPLVRGDTERRLVLNSIGPLWDGNEVWLVTFGGALFAAFPDAYATVLSGFYLPVILVLLSLIGRAISIEFRSKSTSRFWRAYWDFSFFLSSLVATLVFGVALGNVVGGIELSAEGYYVGGLSGLLQPFALAVGLLAVAGAAMHGALYLQLKVEGALRLEVRRWAWVAFFVFVGLNLVVAGMALRGVPHLLLNFERWPFAWAMPVLVGLALANIPRGLVRDRPLQAFASSCASIAGLTFLAAAALYPNLVVSSSSAPSLDIWRSASSEATLRLMAIIAMIGMPLVATYTATVYWVFRGKVELDEHSY
ncbi:cytochrome d ubiquinol oxidase subunit II [Paraliomyxa miuraensis]|uniref:cytochrome d ubiquinol oxidase subunit II n=1 Tax=Paraliomyxa miuraensis TaxID=376150 RepID=UPI00225A46D4|nr:cytochrome d ubiquinol oxidase subunit II [Paraliomyxa miuraensis]MCX4242630.1 cytochrome d ubiquinol oxidase subunit II [Paraliomyxa miuraensis]